MRCYLSISSHKIMYWSTISKKICNVCTRSYFGIISTSLIYVIVVSQELHESIKSPEIRLFVQQIIQANKNGPSKLNINGPLSESTEDQKNPRTKCQWCWEMFHVRVRYTADDMLQNWIYVEAHIWKIPKKTPRFTLLSVCLSSVTLKLHWIPQWHISK